MSLFRENDFVYFTKGCLVNAQPEHLFCCFATSYLLLLTHMLKIQELQRFPHYAVFFPYSTWIT